MLNKLKDILGKTGAVFQNYAMVLVMAFIAAISMICFVELNAPTTEPTFEFLKVALVSALGISLFFGLKMLSQRIGRELVLQLIGILVLVVIYFILPAREKDFTEVYAFVLIPVFLLSHLLVSFVAFIGKNKELNFWQYNKNLFINTFLTGIFTGVLTGGVLLAILAVDQLFDFNFDDHYYSYIFTFFSIFGSCFIFLLFNEKGLQYLERNGDFPVVLKFFTQYILIPLLIIYAIILYFYSAKILINWELPRGWVSYLILAYSVVGIFAILLVHPLKENSAKSWVKMFSKIFYYTLIPLIILLFTAIFTRILEYGYTEPRYFVLIIALWLTSVVFYFIFISRPTVKFVPISLFAFGLFALIFPYFNAFSTAKRSQKAELINVLAKNKLLKNGTIDFNKKTNNSVAADIADKFDFLAKRHEGEFLQTLVKGDLQRNLAEYIKKGNLYEINGLVRADFTNISYDASSVTVEATQRNRTLISKNNQIAISGYQYLFKAYTYRENSFNFEGNKLELNLSKNQFQSEFFLVFNGQKIDLLPEVRQLFAKNPGMGEARIADLNITKKIDGYEFRIIFGNLVQITNNENKKVFSTNAESVLILVKKN
ncbi:protein of unknown function [Kaistella treverensis]|uniref:DUF4153 domain-containing protein n=1 Tax=Kaistella treverensis TaxID=631455 RepID=A0A1I3JW28_9FLAO|nr:DUF4153 domain-containing protein [Kaistella treverensis]SFI64442.1 protein of unknown function [Kaistella treverensis]